MRKFTVFLISAFWVYAFFVGSTTLMAQQQRDYGVFKMKSGNYEGHINTGIDYSGITQLNESGKSTIEFWLKTNNSRKWLLTDMLPDSDRFYIDMSSTGVMTIKAGTSITKTLDLADDVVNNQWAHYSFVLNKTETENTLSVYVDGRVKTEFIGFDIDLSKKRELCFVKSAGGKMCLAEIRAWSVKRTPIEIQEAYIKSYAKASMGRMRTLKSQGLVAYYGSSGEDQIRELPNAILPRLVYKEWINGVTGTTIEGAKFVQEIDDIVVQSLDDEEAHPILNNTTIYADASKGEYDGKIRVKWNHIAGATRYEVREVLPNNLLIGTKNSSDIASTEVSDDIYIDLNQNIDPGTMYKFVVEGFFEDGTSNVASDYGFVFYNGVIAGHIQTSGTGPAINIDSVDVTVRASEGVLPGSGIKFTAGDVPIYIEDLMGFPREDSLTLEFWYKPNEASSSLNKVLKFGDLEVNVSNNKLQIKNHDVAVIDQTIPVFSDWKHFSFVVSPEGYKVYQDSTEIASATTAFDGIIANIRNIKINDDCQASYSLDELRVWNIVRDSSSVVNRYHHIISGKEKGLALYYKMDMNQFNSIYNQAQETRGYYIGKWDDLASQKPEWLSASECCQAMSYGAYTDVYGDYEISGINYGSSGKKMKIIPYKQYHEFSEDSKQETLSAANMRHDDVNFGDNSYMEVVGRVYYYDEGDTDANGEKKIYPVPIGQGFLINGNPITGSGEAPTTTLTGSYTLKSPLGRTRLEVQNPVRVNTIGAYSLVFNGEDNYAESEKLIQLSDATITGFVKMLDNTESEQILLEQGEMKLSIIDNTRLKVKKGDDILLESDISLEANQYQFFTVAYDRTAEKLFLRINNTKKSIRDITLDLNGKLVLGAAMNNGTAEKFLKANLDNLIIYDQYLSEANIEKVKQGKIIDDSEIEPYAKYLFEEGKGIRTLSWTEGGHDKALILKNGLSFDSQDFKPYSYEYKYEYQAVNERYAREDDNIAYRPNVLRPLSDVDFENKTRFGIVGNIRIPCGYGVGKWIGVVKRVDLGEDNQKIYELTSENFNENYTCFTIDGLMPGKYLVEIHREDSPSDESLPLEIDITKGWNIYNFDFENPLIVDTDIFRKAILQEENASAEAHWTFENVEVCDDNPILQKNNYYDMKVMTYQQYSEGKCYVGNFDYKVKKGDLGVVEKKYANKNAGEFVMPVSGIDTVRFLALEPNFDPEEDYLRKMSIDVPSYRYLADIPAVILGVQQSQQDFTVVPPDQLIMVLHDPPGDGSSVAWSRGHTLNFTSTWDFSSNVSTAFDIGTVTETEMQSGVWVGIGGGSVMTVPVTSVDVKDRFSFNVQIGGGYSGSKTYSATLNQAISTEGGGTTVGADADIFIGFSEVLTYGDGRELLREGCDFSVREEMTITRQPKSMFFHTVQHIKDVLIPSLERFKANALTNNNSEEAASYQEKIDRWKEYISDNVSRISSTDTYDNLRMVGGPAGEANASIEGAYNFSANSNITFTIGKEGGETHGAHFNTGLGFDKNFTSSFKAFGAGVQLKTKLSINLSHSNSHAGGNNKSESFTIALDDDDDGDQFYFYVRQDPVYGSPIFKTYGGRSMCPYERGTNPREGISLRGNEVAWAEPGENAIFRLTMRSIQESQDATVKEYVLFPDLANVPAGASLKINGAAFNGPKTYRLAPGATSEEIEVIVKQGASEPGKAVFENIPIIAISACEKANDTYIYTQDEWEETNARPVDTLYLTAYFENNCVESIQMLEPQEGWVINSLDDHEVDVKFKLNNPLTSMTKVHLEMVPVSNANNVSIVKAFTMDEILPATDPLNTNPSNSLVDREGYITTRVRIDRPNGTYKLRLVPVCGAGDEVWRTQTPTEWVTGNIRTTRPVVTNTEPQNAGVAVANSVIRAFSDQPLKESTVNDLNVILRGILPANEYRPSSAVFFEPEDMITASHTSDIELGGAYTVEFWMYPEVYPSVEIPILKKGNGINITLTSDGKINNGYGLSEKIILQRWTHVTVVYDGESDIRTFFDNDVVNISNVTSVPENNTDSFEICGIQNGQSFKGRLDDFRIWNRARVLAEIKIDRSTTLRGDEGGLIFYMPLDDLSHLNYNVLQELVGKVRDVQATGISLTSEADEIAPIDIENSFETIGTTVSLANDNEIIITPTFGNDKLEGALLVARIKDNSVKDPFGNYLPGKSWSFGFNKNLVEWNKANLVINQNQGSSNQFDMTISNNGGVKITYELVDMPSWLTITSDHRENVREHLLAGHSNVVSFETASWLNSGTYKAPIKAKTQAYDPVTGTYYQTGVESFFLEVKIDCIKPEYELDPHSFSKQMNIIAEVSIDGEKLSDPADKVVAFVGNEIRGVASPRLTGSKYLVNIVIYSNSSTAESIEFRVWDDSECIEYVGIDKSYTFSDDNAIGSISDPEIWNVGEIIARRFSAVQGFHWLSFNVTDSDEDYLSLSNLNGFGVDDIIKDKDNNTATWTTNGWTGSLTRLSPYSSYSVELKAQRLIEMVGIPAVVDYDIELDSEGKNWIGYTPNNMMRVREALRSFMNGNVSNNDIVYAKSASSYYYNGDWIGDMQYFSPGQGYKIDVTTGGKLNYIGVTLDMRNNRSSVTPLNLLESPEVTSTFGQLLSEVKDKASSMGYNVNPHAYEYSMHITGVVVDDMNIQNEPMIITAYDENELVGVAVPQMVDNNLLYFLTTFSNDYGKPLDFVAIEPETGRKFEIIESLEFNDNPFIGNPVFPYEFKMGDEIISDNNEDQLMQNIPNPFTHNTTIKYCIGEDMDVQLFVTDAMGQMVVSLVNEYQDSGCYTKEFNSIKYNLQPGIYFYTLSTKNGRITKKMIVE
ncbi:MAG: LamG-like jellyroll fold domain-containing protein [Hyphomicrobiales bacterium]